MLIRLGKLLFCAMLFTGPGWGQALAQTQRPHNVILFIPDGLRPGSVDPKIAPTFARIRDQGVRFVNSHSVFPTLTMVNSAAMGTGHFPGDMGNFANTVYTGFPVPSANGSVNGIADGRGILAACALGAAGVQIGTAYLLCPEAGTPPMHRDALRNAEADASVLTNVFTGRPARALINRFIREVGPMSDNTPPFPSAMDGSAALRSAAERSGSTEFSSFWAGQAAPLMREMPAAELTARLVKEAAEQFARLSGKVI